MTAADLKDTDKQAAPAPGIAKALAFLRREDILSLPDGKYEIDGERVFALVQRYATAAAGAPKFEAHRKYIDVQFIAAGAETIGWAPLDRMKVTEAYDAGKDLCFGSVAAGEWSPVVLRAGQLAILYPEDAHAPKLAAGVPGAVMKVVVKVAVFV
ncbi:MAG: YhcH/YjgK/YiaL family protein [Elusimicrobia bacterium]|nr:YhcH/YjgK/YiaL family protein [Elusimicrobiota bacterium]